MRKKTLYQQLPALAQKIKIKIPAQGGDDACKPLALQ